MKLHHVLGPVAQLAEHLPLKEVVESSILSRLTKCILMYQIIKVTSGMTMSLDGFTAGSIKVLKNHLETISIQIYWIVGCLLSRKSINIKKK
jgi:hypothetical protein